MITKQPSNVNNAPSVDSGAVRTCRIPKTEVVFREWLHRYASSLRGLLAVMFFLVAGDVNAQATAAIDSHNSIDESIDPDVAVFFKAAEWIERHGEFFTDEHKTQTENAVATGRKRAQLLRQGKSPWTTQIGMTVRGYRSKVDQSVQPFALTLPNGFDAKADKYWPLHVVLHGRAAKMNEVNFIHKYNNKPVSEENEGWIQLDVFGRTNNAYRWSGETDVFEAIAKVKSEYRIDDDRVVLRGFSMGGAGAWHLGMHYPHLWCSVGPGAGFVDFYKYQKQSQLLPTHQHQTLGIYDSINYALNAFNVPTCTYGGEKDSQLAAGESMHLAAKNLGIDVKLIVGPNMGHKFDEASRKSFMDFHNNAMKTGRRSGKKRREIRFTTRTLRYNRCHWIAVEEQERVYEPSFVKARYTETGRVVTTKNVRAIRVDLLTEDDSLKIDGQIMVASATSPSIVAVKQNESWTLMDERKFVRNSALSKRHGLQGPIDDAFNEAFVCMRGPDRPWSDAHQAYSDFVLDRFSKEYDKWLRAKLPIDDVSTFDRNSKNKHVVLFGDPGSNPGIAKIIDRLPIEWTRDTITVAGNSYPTKNHAIAMIYPNPLNSAHYVVVNSGHTFHEKDFRSSNAWLFPRLGDIAVQKFELVPDGSFREETVWAANFNANWELEDE